MKTEECPKCKKTYQLGYNGVGDGCDECLGIQRDNQGHAWYPDETHRYKPDGSVVSRQDAFVS